MKTPRFEIIATPDWKTETTPIERWIEAFEALGFTVDLDRESNDVIAIVIESLQLQGHALMQGLNVQAIDFELISADHLEARQAIEAAADSLHWELDDEQTELMDD